MKRIIYLTACVFILGCQSNQKRETKEQTLNDQEKEFKEYLKLFSEQDLPVVIDSLYIQKTLEQNNISKLDSQHLHYVEKEEFEEKCKGTHPKYLIYPKSTFKIEDKYGLLYYVKLNEKCSFEAYYNRIFLGVYNSEGEVISFKEVGLRQDLWDHIKLKYTRIEDNLKMYQTFVEIKGDIETPEDSEIIRKYDTLKINSSGNIE